MWGCSKIPCTKGYSADRLCYNYVQGIVIIVDPHPCPYQAVS